MSRRRHWMFVRDNLYSKFILIGFTIWILHFAVIGYEQFKDDAVIMAILCWVASAVGAVGLMSYLSAPTSSSLKAFPDRSNKSPES